MENKLEVLDKVTNIVTKMLLSTRGEESGVGLNIKPETDIFKDLGIDSVEVMDLLGFIDQEFSITIDPQEAAAKRTIQDIADIVCARLEVERK